jgi:hypothetical protein
MYVQQPVFILIPDARKRYRLMAMMTDDVLVDGGTRMHGGMLA